MFVSFAGAVEYQGCSFSTCILHEPARDQASPCAHRQAKNIDGAKKPQRGNLARIRDGQSEVDRRPGFGWEKRLENMMQQASRRGAVENDKQVIVLRKASCHVTSR
jgi:hypothetical protein